MAVRAYDPRMGSWAGLILSVALISGCGSSGTSYSGANGSYQSGPNIYNSGTTVPANLSFAGAYNAFRTVTIGTTNVTEQDYLYISSSGVISTFIYQDNGTVSPARNCYLPATGSEPNAALQGAQLSATTDSSGNSYYHVTIHGYDIGFSAPSSGGAPNIYINGVQQSNISGATLFVGNQGDTFMLGGGPNVNMTLSSLDICT